MSWPTPVTDYGIHNVWELWFQLVQIYYWLTLLKSKQEALAPFIPDDVICLLGILTPLPAFGLVGDSLKILRHEVEKHAAGWIVDSRDVGALVQTLHQRDHSCSKEKMFRHACCFLHKWKRWRSSADVMDLTRLRYGRWKEAIVEWSWAPFIPDDVIYLLGILTPLPAFGVLFDNEGVKNPVIQSPIGPEEYLKCLIHVITE
ncbi:hypothetical protein F2Q69_00061372 [Brassica cretica]|uniref:Uncharacterized protein n=1 Tax=Brassica cretica TaxID=69181 RepID=A0A8S9RMA3_BRACR|nr:hypothetical protein F2Q69_00061372 [Brassica cretica]